ncbi:MAG: DUF445 family protein [Tepidanaerobacteraceae bacterium]|nr:DUF445 family protein [Tepidanaerobacteraceae bacterium]
MSIYIQLALMPLIGALIGWGTNLFAIKLIFRPLRPVKIPFLGIEIQGLIPKRRLDISRNIGEALEQEIISPEEIIDNLTSEKTKAEIIKYIKHVVMKRVSEKLPVFIPSAFRESIATYLGDMIDHHGNEIFDEMKATLVDKAKQEFRLKEIVEEKINSFDLEQLEELIIMLSRQELKQIEILGGIIGFFIGIAQAVLTYYLVYINPL